MMVFLYGAADVLIQSEKEENSGRTTPELTLYWDSWDGANVPASHGVATSHADCSGGGGAGGAPPPAAPAAAPLG